MTCASQFACVLVWDEGLQSLWARVTPRMELGAAVIAVALILLFWIWLRAARKRSVELKKSSDTDQIARELARIADALEAMQRKPAEGPKPGGETEPTDEMVRARRMIGSMFRR